MSWEENVKLTMRLLDIANISKEDAEKIVDEMSWDVMTSLCDMFGIYPLADFMLVNHIMSDWYQERVRRCVVTREKLSAITDVAVLQNLAREEVNAGDAVRALFVVEVSRHYTLLKKNRYFTRCELLDAYDKYTVELEDAIAHPNYRSPRDARGRFQRKWQALRDAIECRRYIISKIPSALKFHKKESALIEKRNREEEARERSWEGVPEPRGLSRAQEYELDRQLSRAADAIAFSGHEDGWSPDRAG